MAEPFQVRDVPENIEVRWAELFEPDWASWKNAQVDNDVDSAYGESDNQS